MSITNDEHKLQEASKKLKINVIEIEKKLRQQDLLLESITHSTEKNVINLKKGTNKLTNTIAVMKKDKRNYIILILVLLIIILCFYIFT